MEDFSALLVNWDLVEMKKSQSAMLIRYPRTVRVSEKLSFGKWQFKPADLSFENKISAESVQKIFKLAIWNIC